MITSLLRVGKLEDPARDPARQARRRVTDADLTTWVQTLDDRLAQVRDRLRQQWPDLPPDLHRQAQQLGPHQLAALLETLPQLASPEALADWLYAQQPTQ